MLLPINHSNVGRCANVTVAPVAGVTAAPSGPPAGDSPYTNDDPNKRSLCNGYAPDEAQVEYRNLPTCIGVSPQFSSGSEFRAPERPMCMFGGESLSDPPMWCYSDDSVSYHKRYYLWWSPCRIVARRVSHCSIRSVVLSAANGQSSWIVSTMVHSLQ